MCIFFFNHKRSSRILFPFKNLWENFQVLYVTKYINFFFLIKKKFEVKKMIDKKAHQIMAYNITKPTYDEEKTPHKD